MSNFWPRGQKLPERNQKGPDQDPDWRNRRPAPYENQHPHAIAKRKRSDTRGNDQNTKWARGQTPAGETKRQSSEWRRAQPLGRRRNSGQREKLFSIAYINLQDVGMDVDKLDDKIQFAKRILNGVDGLFVSEIWTNCIEQETDFVRRMKEDYPFVRSQRFTGHDMDCHVVYFFGKKPNEFRCYDGKYCSKKIPVPVKYSHRRFLPVQHVKTGINIVGIHAYRAPQPDNIDLHGVIQTCISYVKSNFIILGDFNATQRQLDIHEQIGPNIRIISGSGVDHIIRSPDFQRQVQTSKIRSGNVSDHDAWKVTVFN